MTKTASATTTKVSRTSWEGSNNRAHRLCSKSYDLNGINIGWAIMKENSNLHRNKQICYAAVHQRTTLSIC